MPVGRGAAWADVVTAPTVAWWHGWQRLTSGSDATRFALWAPVSCGVTAEELHGNWGSTVRWGDVEATEEALDSGIQRRRRSFGGRRRQWWLPVALGKGGKSEALSSRQQEWPETKLTLWGIQWRRQLQNRRGVVALRSPAQIGGRGRGSRARVCLILNGGGAEERLTTRWRRWPFIWVGDVGEKEKGRGSDPVCHAKEGRGSWARCRAARRTHC
jgi:hypothetical protein